MRRAASRPASNVCNVTFALESTWDQTMSAVDEGFAKIEASPVLALARNRAEIDAALAAGRLAVVPGTQGSSMIGKELARVGVLSPGSASASSASPTPGPRCLPTAAARSAMRG